MQLTSNKKLIQRQKGIIEKLIEKEGLSIDYFPYSYWNNCEYVVDDTGQRIFSLCREGINDTYHCSFIYRIWELIPDEFLIEFNKLVHTIKRHKAQKEKVFKILNEIESILNS